MHAPAHRAHLETHPAKAVQSRASATAAGIMLLGGTALALLDLAFAMAFWAWHDVPPIRIPQSIAAWVIGLPTAHAGGMATAMLGLLLYVGVVCAVVATYRAASRAWPVLWQRPLRCGPVYGLLMYVLIFELAVPSLSLAGATPRRLDWTIACVIGYMLLIGLPTALIARGLHLRR
jgi:hypothetical protein